MPTRASSCAAWPRAGVMGGLARSTLDVILLLDAFGKDVVLVETVGVGQDEVEIARAADTTLVVGVPGLGDDIQAIKAGILEIADILVVNKADLVGADRLAADLRTMLQLGEQRSAWPTPIHQTVATDGQGVPELVDRIDGASRVSGAERSLARAARGQCATPGARDCRGSRDGPFAAADRRRRVGRSRSRRLRRASRTPIRSPKN